MKRQPTTQQITWFLDLYRTKQLDLTPPYQRKSVWSSKDRKYFLDTIFRNYPAPPIFIHRTVNESGYATYHIVDGKQRLETIIDFFNDKLSIANDFNNTDLNGKKFSQISIEYKRVFWDYTLVVDFIDSIDGTNIEEVFDRVNRNSKNLQPQELRHAKYNGWFIKRVESESEENFWWDYKISTRDREKRMKNVQFISELFLINLDKKISGFSHDYLDNSYANYDDIDELSESLNFSESNFIEEIGSLKDFIRKCDDHNNCITEFVAGSNSNFYTLWAYLTFNKPVDHTVFSDKYKEFMTYISIRTVEINGDNKNYDQIVKYVENNKGASTELIQRTNRLDALSNYIGNENS